MGNHKKSAVIAGQFGSYPKPKLDWQKIEGLAEVVLNKTNREAIERSIKIYYSKQNAHYVYSRDIEPFAEAAKELAEKWEELKPKLSYKTHQITLLQRLGEYDDVIAELKNLSSALSGQTNDKGNNPMSPWDVLICDLYVTFEASGFKITLPSLSSVGAKMSKFQRTVKYILISNKIEKSTDMSDQAFAQALYRATKYIRERDK